MENGIIYANFFFPKIELFFEDKMKSFENCINSLDCLPTSILQVFQ